jgi:hypothetical protein
MTFFFSKLLNYESHALTFLLFLLLLQNHNIGPVRVGDYLEGVGRAVDRGQAGHGGAHEDLGSIR